MTSQRKRLSQLELVSAILLEVDRQGIKTVSVQDMNAIREAADTIVAAVGQRADATQLTDEQGKPQ
jgi:NADPH-dependent glutamate synthase beta subunit-like oxidoreductase